MGRGQWTRTGSRFRLWQPSVVDIAGVSFQSAVVDGHVRPLVLTEEVPEVTIPIGRRCTKLHILGHVTLPSGYPLQGQSGEVVAVYSIVGANGASQDIPVRNGFEGQERIVFTTRRASNLSPPRRNQRLNSQKISLGNITSFRCGRYPSRRD